MIGFNLLLLVNAFISIQAYTQLIQTSSCRNNGNSHNESCSPAWCNRVSNSACTPASNIVNIQGTINSLSCRVCTQSTNAKCTQSYFDTVLKKSK